jgi:hypothetical protein
MVSSRGFYVISITLPLGTTNSNAKSIPKDPEEIVPLRQWLYPIFITVPFPVGFI